MTHERPLASQLGLVGQVAHFSELAGELDFERKISLQMFAKLADPASDRAA